MANETEIRSALTPEQWTAMHMAQPGADLEIRLIDEGNYGIRPPSLHAIAALALHGQPFGFTREMVTGLVYMLTLAEYGASEAHHMAATEKAVVRIIALLPPNEHQLPSSVDASAGGGCGGSR